jgi:hypothetical protein
MASFTSATAYLEIGIEHGYTLEAVKISTKVGVDPHPLFSLKSLPAGVTVHSVESDRFFETLTDDVKFDIIFLDGFHTYQQTYRDLMNSLRHLASRGVIIIDDVVPSDEISAIPELDVSISQQVEHGVTDFRWHGDVFRLIPLLRDHHPELQFRTLIGSGNEQTVLWKADPILESIAVDEATVAAYAKVSYEDTFANGIPEFFGSGSDEDVLQAIKSFRESR